MPHKKMIIKFSTTFSALENINSAWHDMVDAIEGNLQFRLVLNKCSLRHSFHLSTYRFATTWLRVRPTSR